MDGHHLAPIGEREVLDGMDDLNARVGNQNIHAAPCGDHRRHAVFDGLLIGDIHRHRHARYAEAGEFIHRRLRRSEVEVGYCNLRTLTPEGERDFLADTGGSTRDQGHLVLKLCHLLHSSIYVHCTMTQFQAKFERDEGRRAASLPSVLL